MIAVLIATNFCKFKSGKYEYAYVRNSRKKFRVHIKVFTITDIAMYGYDNVNHLIILI